MGTAIGDYIDFKCHVSVGGTSVKEDAKILLAGVHIVIGTPGRVHDMLEQRKLKASHISMFVLDEADDLLSRGFKDQIYKIYQLLPSNLQVGLFSATLPDEALDITRQFMNNPVRILVKKEELSIRGIKQFYVDVRKEEWKIETLCDLYETMSIAQSIIFVNSKKKVDLLSEKMSAKDHSVSSLHGDMDKDKRSEIMNHFRQGISRVLITTDVLARGIDVQQVSLVINYDLPLQYENYLHRIGRTGRFGRKGVAINFVRKTTDDMTIIKKLEKFYETAIEELSSDFADWF